MQRTVENHDYYVCDRCEITSETEGRMCPCPRGSCDAEKKGEVIIVKTIIMDNERGKKDDDSIEQIIASINV